MEVLNQSGLNDFSKNQTVIKNYESNIHDGEVENADHLFKEEEPIKQNIFLEQFSNGKENSMYDINIEYEVIDIIADLKMYKNGDTKSSEQVLPIQTDEPANLRKRKYTKKVAQVFKDESIATTKSKRTVKPVHYELRDYKCESWLRKHLVEMHGGDKFPWRCVFCKDLFATQVEMLAHLSINVDCNAADQKLFVCHQCRDMEGTNKGLYFCDICLKSFKSSEILTKHWKRHNASKSIYVCSFCQKSFEKHQCLIKHRKEEHLNEKQTCQICKTPTANLAEHIKRTHLGKSFNCCFCPMTFVSKYGLERHERCQHTGEIHITCDICDWGAPDYFIMNKHKLEHDKYVDENGQYLPLPSPTVVNFLKKKFFTETCCGPDEPGICKNCQDDLQRQQNNVLVNSKFTDTQDLKFFIAFHQRKH